MTMGKNFKHDWTGYTFKNGMHYRNSELHIDLPHFVKSEEAPIKKISFWQRFRTAVGIWIDRIILKIRRNLKW